MNIYIPPTYTIDLRQRLINFTNDRADFEREMSARNTKAVEFYTAMRTKDGYTEPNLHHLFYGWLMCRDASRGIILPALIQPPQPELKPTQVLRTIYRTDTIWWGDTEFKSPGRQEYGVSIGYVKVRGNQWPYAFDVNTGQVIYDEYSDNIGAEYIDIVAVGSFDMHDDDFKTTMREAENFATLLMSDSNVRVKTHLTLCDPKASVNRCELVRLTITHDDFLADQARWK